MRQRKKAHLSNYSLGDMAPKYLRKDAASSKYVEEQKKYVEEQKKYVREKKDPRFKGPQIIPKKLSIIWIGGMPAPMKWINTWTRMNPNWEFKLWGNKEFYGRRWKNQEMIDHYLQFTENNIFRLKSGARLDGAKAKYFQWHIIADILRYEILFEEGGYMPGADTECLRSIDDKFGSEGIYTVNTGCLYEKEYNRAMENWKKLRFAPENASPILASIPGHWFLEKMIEELPKREWGEAVDTTGNVFVGDMIRKYGVPEDMRTVPYVRQVYRLNPYSIHHAGTTTGVYGRGV